MKFVTSTAVVALLALGPAPALQAADASGGSTKAGTSHTSDQTKIHSGKQQAPASVTVSSAQDLIGHSVVDRAGEDAGEVQHLLINTDTGKISEVIVGSSDSFDIGDDLVAIPWHAIDAAKSNEDLTLRVPRDALKNAPRVEEDDFASLTEPMTITTIYDYYAPLVVADSGQSGQTGNKDKSESMPQNSSSSKANDQMAESSSNAGQSHDPIAHLLVGREVVTVLAPPALLSADDVKGTEVRSSDGQQIGEIDQIMVDVHRGQVAYLLIEDGGFLGIGEERLPVPMAALDWSPRDDVGFVIDANGAELKEMKSLTGYDDPAKIKGEQLAALYKRFDVQPYWSSQASNQNQTASSKE